MRYEVPSSSKYNCPPMSTIWDLPVSKLRIRRQSEEFRPMFLSLMISLRQTMVLNAELKSIKHHAQTSPSCGKGLCAVHRKWHQPWGCTVSVKVCMFKSWGLSLKPCEKMTQLPWQHQETVLNHYVCEYACLCVCVSVSRSDRKSVRKTKKQNKLPN